MEESDPEEEVKGGYNSDDAQSQKTDVVEYENSDEHIDLTDLLIVEDDRCSAKFSELGDDKMSIEELSGHFS